MSLRLAKRDENRCGARSHADQSKPRANAWKTPDVTPLAPLGLFFRGAVYRNSAVSVAIFSCAQRPRSAPEPRPDSHKTLTL